MTKKNFFITAGPLLLILFIDGMGLGLVIPILNSLLVDPSSQFLAGADDGLRNLIFGCTLGLFMLCWFVGAPFLGDLSDQIGRKRSLMICLLGSAIGYAISALGVMHNSFTLLIIGRVIAGFTSGSQPIAQAAVVDLSTSDTKTRNIGFVLLALSLGFIFGPLIGGLLSNKTIVPWFNLSLPFYFAMVISFLNALLLHFSFRETFIPKVITKPKITKAIEIFISAFKHPKINKLSIFFLMMVFGWSSYYSFISMFLLKNFGLTTFEITIFMAIMGIGFGLGNGFLANFFAKRFSHPKIVIVTTTAGAMGILFCLLFKQAFTSWLLIIPIATVLSVAYSVSLTMFSNEVDEQSQGWVMGITGAMLALIFGLDAIVLGYLSNFYVDLPIILASLGLFASSYLMLRFSRLG